MHNTVAVQQVERRLLELGSPVAQVRRKVRELAEHHEDLKTAAMEVGLSEADAGVRADELLGEPAGLAQHLAAALRQSSWWGRHPVIGFCLLPPLVFLPVSCLCFLVLCGGFQLTNFLPGAHVSMHDMGAALNADPGGFQNLYESVNILVNCMAVCAGAVLFCWLARRSASGWGWMLMTCAVCSATGLFGFFALAPHSVNLAYGYSRNWLSAAVPLLIAAAVLLRHWLSTRHLPVLPARVVGFPAASHSNPPLIPSGNRLITPTSVTAALLIAAFTTGSFWARVAYARERAQENARQAELRSSVWPAERAAVEKRVRARQLIRETAGETTIDLQPFVNASLADPIASTADVQDDNLAELPAGIHLYGGVPFDVEGVIQLMGRGLLERDRIFPTRAKGIVIGRKCSRLHLFHGASFSPAKEDSSPGVKIARLVLHYADGSQQEVGIVAGQDVLDWQGPLYATGAGNEPVSPASSGTELAWTGSSPRLRGLHSQLSLRLYRSTFANPRPDLEISRVDYISTLTPAAPFLLGLTVE